MFSCISPHSHPFRKWVIRKPVFPPYNNRRSCKACSILRKKPNVNGVRVSPTLTNHCAQYPQDQTYPLRHRHRWRRHMDAVDPRTVRDGYPNPRWYVWWRQMLDSRCPFVSPKGSPDLSPSKYTSGQWGHVHFCLSIHQVKRQPTCADCWQHPIFTESSGRTLQPSIPLGNSSFNFPTNSITLFSHFSSNTSTLHITHGKSVVSSTPKNRAVGFTIPAQRRPAFISASFSSFLIFFLLLILSGRDMKGRTPTNHHVNDDLTSLLSLCSLHISEQFDDGQTVAHRCHKQTTTSTLPPHWLL